MFVAVEPIDMRGSFDSLDGAVRRLGGSVLLIAGTTRTHCDGDWLSGSRTCTPVADDAGDLAAGSRSASGSWSTAARAPRAASASSALANRHDAPKAIELVDGTELEGRRLVVNVATER